MPCFSPLIGWRARDRTKSGKRGVVFQLSQGYKDQPIEVPCGRCIGCRIVRARAWAVRCMHEASLHDENCFITLTYRDECCPWELKVRDLQLFMKRLRQHVGVRLRYFAVGEYGEKFARPHYHLLLFGYDFKDKVFWKGSGMRKQYRSDLLERLWTDGFALVGTVTTASAQYVSQYCTKIITGAKAKEHYNGRRPEFAVMSRNPGLGQGWLEKYGNVLFERDFVVVEGGKRCAIPRFYLGKMPECELAKLKAERAKVDFSDEARGCRAIARAECAQGKVDMERRGYEK